MLLIVPALVQVICGRMPVPSTPKSARGEAEYALKAAIQGWRNNRLRHPDNVELRIASALEIVNRLKAFQKVQPGTALSAYVTPDEYFSILRDTLPCSQDPSGNH